MPTNRYDIPLFLIIFFIEKKEKRTLEIAKRDTEIKKMIVKWNVALMLQHTFFNLKIIEEPEKKTQKKIKYDAWNLLVGFRCYGKKVFEYLIIIFTNNINLR